MGSEVVAVTIAQAAEGGSAEQSLFSTLTHSGPLAFSVLILLVVFSVVSWGIIILKWLAIRQASRTSVEFLEVFWQSKRLDEIFAKTEQLGSSPIAQVVRAGYQ